MMMNTIRLLCISVFLPLLGCGSPEVDADGYLSLFNGKNLDGWEGDPTYWRVEDGVLIGEITPETLLDENTFLIWRGGRPADFELKAEYRLSPEANSGINYRSEEVKGQEYALKGYQGDMNYAGNYTGMNYEERGRTTIARPAERVVLPPVTGSMETHIVDNRWAAREVRDTLDGAIAQLEAIQADAWNEYHIIARGNRLQHFINGVLVSEVVDEDEAHRRSEGLIGVQVHVGPPMQVAYRNFRLREF